MGAWIETFITLKNFGIEPVALRVGAWIETAAKLQERELENVALRVGAWIETIDSVEIASKLRRAPCGRVD